MSLLHESSKVTDNDLVKIEPAAHRPLEPLFAEVEVPQNSEAAKIRIEATAQKISEEHGLSLLTSKILAARGLAIGPELDRFISPVLDRDLPDKWSLKNLDAATIKILAAIESGKKIAICSDFDVDGTTSATIIAKTLRAVGAKVIVYSPDRFSEGYGLNENIVRSFAKKGCELLITLDFGTKNHTELKLAKSLGMESIVVDHHDIPDDQNPIEATLINPKQNGCGFNKEDLCTAGLAWVVATALKEKFLESTTEKIKAGAEKINSNDLLPYAALGTIADLVKLEGANRAIAKRGLKLLGISKEPGLRALREIVGISGDVVADDVAFQIAPRINAASRVIRGKLNGLTGGMTVIKLFNSRTITKARELAILLDEKNTERKAAERALTKQVLGQIRELDTLPPAFVIVLPHTGTIGGVLGIVASRVVDQYHRPTIILAQGDDGLAKGSARSIEGIHLAKTLQEAKELLFKFGGHAGAAGLGILNENIEAFREKFESLCAKLLEKLPGIPIQRGDVEVTISDINNAGPKGFKELQLLEPCGRGNPAPKLLITGVKVVAATVANDTDLRVWLRQDGAFVHGMLWHRTDHPALKSGETVDLVVRPVLNSYRAEHNTAKQKVEVEILAVRKTT